MYKKLLIIGAVVLAIATVLVGVLSQRSSGDPASSVSLVGTWKGELNNANFVATITAGDISVNWQTEDTVALYWQGSFATPEDILSTRPIQIISHGDKAAMQDSLLASRNEIKVFTYKEGKLSFELTVMGVTQTVRLSK